MEGVTEYTYDALGQLVSEKVNNVMVNTMTYDNWGYLGGNGVGSAYWKKNLFSKGGYFVYKGVAYYSTRSLKLLKPVIKDFVKSFGIYIVTQILDWLQKFIRGKV